MSKNNVNPNHYKVAGRERQGEDILQERHRQKHARSLARERFEPRPTSPYFAGPGPGALEPGPPPPGPSAASTAKPSAASTAKQVPASKQKARTKAATPRSTATAAVKKTAKTGAKKRAAPPTVRKATMNAQASDKRGTRSTAQKRASSRNDFESMPATRPVAGAHGKEPSPRRRTKR